MIETKDAKKVVFNLIIISQWGLAQEKNGKEEEGKGCVEMFSWRGTGCSHPVPIGNIFNSDNDEKIQAPCLCYKEKFYQLGMIKKIKAQVKPMLSGRVNIIPVLRAISPWVTPLLCDYIGSKMCLPHVLPHLLRPILGALVSKTAVWWSRGAQQPFFIVPLSF